MQFEDFTNAQLKKIIRQYNHHLIIKGYSKLSRDDLLKHIKKHMTIDDEKIMLKAYEPVYFDVPESKQRKNTKKKIDKALEKKIVKIQSEPSNDIDAFDNLLKFKVTGDGFNFGQRSKGDAKKKIGPYAKYLLEHNRMDLMMKLPARLKFFIEKIYPEYFNKPLTNDVKSEIEKYLNQHSLRSFKGSENDKEYRQYYNLLYKLKAKRIDFSDDDKIIFNPENKTDTDRKIIRVFRPNKVIAGSNQYYDIHRPDYFEHPERDDKLIFNYE